jgi:hypothetical protein
MVIIRSAHTTVFLPFSQMAAMQIVTAIPFLLQEILGKRVA